MESQLAAIADCGDRAHLVEIWQNPVENAVTFMGEQTDPRAEIATFFFTLPGTLVPHAPDMTAP